MYQIKQLDYLLNKTLYWNYIIKFNIDKDPLKIISKSIDKQIQSKENYIIFGVSKDRFTFANFSHIFKYFVTLYLILVSQRD